MNAALLLLTLAAAPMPPLALDHKDHYEPYEKIVITADAGDVPAGWELAVFWNVADPDLEFVQVGDSTLHVWAKPGRHSLFCNMLLINFDTKQMRPQSQSITFTVGEAPNPPPKPDDPDDPDPPPKPPSGLDAIIKQVRNETVTVRMADGNAVQTTTYAVIAKALDGGKEAELATLLPIDAMRSVSDMLRQAKAIAQPAEIAAALRRLDK